MLRSILAVVAGFLVIGALAGLTDLAVRAMVPGLFAPNGAVTDPMLLGVTEVYVFVYATFGCWLCARIARRRPMFHALVLGVLGLIFNVVGSSMTWQLYPAWYHVVALILVMPAAWLGGWIAERQLENRPAGLAGAAA
jgi:hypothetical protein